MSAEGKTVAPVEHYVSAAPFDPDSIERLTAEQERMFRDGLLSRCDSNKAARP